MTHVLKIRTILQIGVRHRIWGQQQPALTAWGRWMWMTVTLKHFLFPMMSPYLASLVLAWQKKDIRQAGLRQYRPTDCSIITHWCMHRAVKGVALTCDLISLQLMLFVCGTLCVCLCVQHQSCVYNVFLLTLYQITSNWQEMSTCMILKTILVRSNDCICSLCWKIGSKHRPIIFSNCSLWRASGSSNR